MTTTDLDPRTLAYATFADVDAEGLPDIDDDNTIEGHLVLTDDEADEMAAELIRDSVWAFQSWFIADYCPDGIDGDHITALRGDSCEGANEALIALVDAGAGMAAFIEGAIGYDGRGHFISQYDGEEHEEGEFFIYRVD